MAPLAKIELERGNRITGSDKERTDKTAELARCGAQIAEGHCAENLPADTDLVVYTSACARDNPELLAASARNIPLRRRGEHLAALAGEYDVLAAVSGSHGKTSITSMLAHIAMECGRDAGFLIGGAVPGKPSSRAGDGRLFITEADESDGTHVLLNPTFGIVPNMEDDHEWSLGGPEALRANFVRFAAQSATLLYFDSPATRALAAEHPSAVCVDAPLPEFPGFIGVNAALALKAAELLGLDSAAARRALQSWPGVLRRMTLHVDTPEKIVLEDYAHHPTELAALLGVLRVRYPERHLRILFQPHRYARLAKYRDAFAEVLRDADSALILPVFAAWSETGDVSAADLACDIGEAAQAFDRLEDALPAALREADRPLLIALVGAGDLDRLLPALVTPAP